MVKRKGIIWVVDSPLGHLAVAHRSQALQKMVQEPTRLFYDIDEVKRALPARFTPTALLIGYCDIPEAVRLLNDPQFNQLPVLVTDAHRQWPREELPESVIISTEDVIGAIRDFVDNVLGRRLYGERDRWKADRMGRGGQREIPRRCSKGHAAGWPSSAGDRDPGELR